MGNLLKVMCSRALINIRMFIGIICVALCIGIDSVDLLPKLFQKDSALDVHYFWFNAITYGGIYGKYFLAVIVTLPYSGDFCIEYMQGVWRYILMKSGRKCYAFTKYVACFISGGGVAAAGGSLFIMLASGNLELFLERRYVEIQMIPFAELLMESPKKYFAIALYLIFLSGGLWSCIGYTISCYFPFKYAVHISPFLIAFIITRINVIFNIPNRLRIDYWYIGRTLPLDGKYGIFVVSVVTIFIWCVLVLVFYKKVGWRQEHE